MFLQLLKKTGGSCGQSHPAGTRLVASWLRHGGYLAKADHWRGRGSLVFPRPRAPAPVYPTGFVLILGKLGHHSRLPGGLPAEQGSVVGLQECLST